MSLRLPRWSRPGSAPRAGSTPSILATLQISEVAAWSQPSSTTIGGYRRILLGEGSAYLYGNGRVERYTLGHWEAPQVTWKVGEGLPLVDAALCGGRLWIGIGVTVPPSSHGAAESLSGFDPSTGLLTVHTDLAALVPGTLPIHVTSLEPLGHLVLVSLVRPDESGWDPAGRIVAIDCATGRPSGTWVSRPDALLRPNAAEPGTLWVLQSVEDGSHQGLYRLAPSDSKLEGPLFDGPLGEGATSISDIAASPTGRLAVAESVFPGLGARGGCLDLNDGSLDETESLACTVLSFPRLRSPNEIWTVASRCLQGRGSRIFRWQMDRGCSSLGAFEIDDFLPASMELY